jgi:hypothetical protein
MQNGVNLSVHLPGSTFHLRNNSGFQLNVSLNVYIKVQICLLGCTAV